MPHQHNPRRARIAFSDAAAKQLETITSEAELHALDRALVVVSVDPNIGEPLPGDSTNPHCASKPTTSNECAFCTGSPPFATWSSSRTSRSEASAPRRERPQRIPLRPVAGCAPRQVSGFLARSYLES